MGEVLLLSPAVVIHWANGRGDGFPPVSLKTHPDPFRTPRGCVGQAQLMNPTHVNGCALRNQG